MSNPPQKKWDKPRSVEFACSSCVCVGSLWVLWLSNSPKTCKLRVMLIGHSKLPLGVHVSVVGCLSLFCMSTLQWTGNWFRVYPIFAKWSQHKSASPWPLGQDIQWKKWLDGLRDWWPCYALLWCFNYVTGCILPPIANLNLPFPRRFQLFQYLQRLDQGKVMKQSRTKQSAQAEGLLVECRAVIFFLKLDLHLLFLFSPIQLHCSTTQCIASSKIDPQCMSLISLLYQNTISSQK